MLSPKFITSLALFAIIVSSIASIILEGKDKIEPLVNPTLIEIEECVLSLLAEEEKARVKKNFEHYLAIAFLDPIEIFIERESDDIRHRIIRQTLEGRFIGRLSAVRIDQAWSESLGSISEDAIRIAFPKNSEHRVLIVLKFEANDLPDYPLHFLMWCD
jgi:hypothetical protein